ncbi:MAG: DnaJ domain-containing protein, partial [Cyanobacteria bacterium P01_A01_bin.40]
MNHYQVLQVSSQATQQEIKQSYRRLAKKFHPDSQKS